MVSRCFIEKPNEHLLMVPQEHTVKASDGISLMLSQEVRAWCLDAQFSFTLNSVSAKLAATQEWLRWERVLLLHFPDKKDMAMFKLMWGGIIPEKTDFPH